MEINDQRFTLRERTPGTHWTGGWVGPSAGLGTEFRGKLLLPLPEIEPRSPGSPIRSQTLYWLSYPSFKTAKARMKKIRNKTPKVKYNLDVETKKTHKSAIQKRIITKLRYLVTTLTNQNCIYEKKSNLNQAALIQFRLLGRVIVI
jgi:hypothetical protein